MRTDAGQWADGCGRLGAARDQAEANAKQCHTKPPMLVDSHHYPRILTRAACPFVAVVIPTQIYSGGDAAHLL